MRAVDETQNSKVGALLGEQLKRHAHAWERGNGVENGDFDSASFVFGAADRGLER